jgi:hypothetical protein
MGGQSAPIRNVQAKTARATDEPANQHNARGARSLFGRRQQFPANANPLKKRAAFLPIFGGLQAGFS